MYFILYKLPQSLGNQRLINIRQWAQLGAADKGQITGQSKSTTKTYILSVKEASSLKQNTFTQKSEQADISAL